MIEEFRTLRVIHTLFDDAEKYLEKELKVPICVPNCGLCCELNCTTIHSIEASLIISYVIGYGQKEVIDRCRGWLLEKHSQAPTYSGMPRGLINGQLQEEWQKLRVTPCPLLTADKKCPVHRFRPMVCRAFGITRYPDIYCKRPLAKGESIYNRGHIGNLAAGFLKDQVKQFLAGLDPDMAKSGFLPAMIFRQARKKEFRDLVADNKIASAKLVGLDYSVNAMWQTELDAMWNPDKAVDLVNA